MAYPICRYRLTINNGGLRVGMCEIKNWVPFFTRSLKSLVPGSVLFRFIPPLSFNQLRKSGFLNCHELRYRSIAEFIKLVEKLDVNFDRRCA